MVSYKNNNDCNGMLFMSRLFSYTATAFAITIIYTDYTR